ncbi:MAG: hypothetical protein GXP63_05590 [DPANN group archaeon]|nr:hypothetical protein [DPANN group archaeon]
MKKKRWNSVAVFAVILLAFFFSVSAVTDAALHDPTTPLTVESSPESATENNTSGNDTSCPGDANGDGVVDVIDLNIVSVNYGLSSGFDSRADLNGDGVVDVVATSSRPNTA